MLVDVGRKLQDEGLLEKNLGYLVNGVHISNKGMRDILNDVLGYMNWSLKWSEVNYMKWNKQKIKWNSNLSWPKPQKWSFHWQCKPQYMWTDHRHLQVQVGMGGSRAIRMRRRGGGVTWGIIGTGGVQVKCVKKGTSLYLVGAFFCKRSELVIFWMRSFGSKKAGGVTFVPKFPRAGANLWKLKGGIR